VETCLIGFIKLGNKRVVSLEKETTLSNMVVALPRSPLGDSSFDNPFLILPNLLSSNTPIPFL